MSSGPLLCSAGRTPEKAFPNLGTPEGMEKSASTF